MKLSDENKDKLFALSALTFVVTQPSTLLFFALTAELENQNINTYGTLILAIINISSLAITSVLGREDEED